MSPLLARLILLAPLLSSFVGLAQTPGALQALPAAGAAITSKPLEGTGIISGLVLCDDTHAPARGASVLLLRHQAEAGGMSGLHHVSTDVNGRFRFDHLPAGDYGLLVTLTGYLSYQPPPLPAPAGQTPPSPAVTVHPGERVTQELTLYRGASFSGRVLYADGSPAVGAELRVEDVRPLPADPAHPGQPAFKLQQHFSLYLKTDDRGNFHLPGVEPGTYRVAAIARLRFVNSAAEFGILNDGNELPDRVADLIVFSGDTLHRAQAKLYTVRAGDDITGIAITIPLDDRHQVGGTLATAGGLSPNVGMVTLTDHADPQIHFVTAVGKDGSFAFPNIPSGTYGLTVEHCFVVEPDRTTAESDEDADDIATHAFAKLEGAVVVAESDEVDLHFALREVPVPPVDKSR